MSTYKPSKEASLKLGPSATKVVKPKIDGRGRPPKPVGTKAINYEVESPRDNPETFAIQDRFFEAMDYLKAKDPEFSVYAFAKRYRINRGKLSTLRTSDTLVLPILYLHFLVKDYNVSGRFLLTGEGPILDKN